ncbi:MAG: hypothetical protein ABEJ68_00775 [Halobacteriaceae archaeon]
MTPPRRLALAATALLAVATLSPAVVTAEALLGGATLRAVELPALLAFPAAALLLAGLARKRVPRGALAVACLGFVGYGALAVVAAAEMARVAMSAGAFEVTGRAVVVGALGLGAAAVGPALTDRVPRRVPLVLPVALLVVAAFVPFDPLQRAAVREPLPHYAVGVFGLLQVTRFDGGLADATTLVAEWVGAALVLVGTTTGVAKCFAVGVYGSPPANYRVSYSLAENTLRYGTQYAPCRLSPNLDAALAGTALLLVAPVARWGLVRFGPDLRARLAQS